jgi:hypothetical protein
MRQRQPGFEDGSHNRLPSPGPIGGSLLARAFAKANALFHALAAQRRLPADCPHCLRNRIAYRTAVTTFCGNANARRGMDAEEGLFELMEGNITSYRLSANT